MPKWIIHEDVAYVSSAVKAHIRVHIDLTDFQRRFPAAQRRLGEMVLESSKPFMPFLTGSLQQRSYVAGNGRQVIFPGPYARYLYGGVVMVDSVTGKGPALIHDRNGVEVGLRFRKGATLVPTTRKLNFSRPGAQAEWVEAAKDKDKLAWFAELDRIIIKGEV